VSECEYGNTTNENRAFLQRKSKSPLPDMSAEERYYSRSLKIRLGVLECLIKLALQQKLRPQPPWQSFEDLGSYCANYVFSSGWDGKPASSVTAARWCKQFFYSNSFFTAMPQAGGLFCVGFRSPQSESLAVRLLKTQKAKRRAPKFSPSPLSAREQKT